MSEAAAVGASDQGGVVESFYRFMEEQPSSLTFWLLALALAPVLTLLHELGHAVVAVHRVPGPVEVRVGGESALLTVRLGRITLHLHPLVLPWRFDGLCRWDASRATAADVLLVSLAGPGASALGAIGTGLLLRTAPSGSFVRDVLLVATLCGAGSVVLCLVPMTLRERRGGPALRTDGAQAVEAVRVLLGRGLPATVRVQATTRPTTTWREANGLCRFCGEPDFDFQSLRSLVCGCSPG